MSDLVNRIREEAKKLFSGDNAVAFVLGHKKSPVLPGRAVPFYARSADDCDELIFDHTCQINLSGLLKLHHRQSKRFAIVAKGCDIRGVVSLLQEKQLLREQVVIIGVPCEGTVDFNLVDDLSEVPVKEDKILEERCKACDVKVPHFYDVYVGEEEEEKEKRKNEAAALPRVPPAAKDLLDKDLDERWQDWEKALSACIRCHACRKNCPVCACNSCIFEETNPTWVDRSTNPSDNVLYSMIRLWHLSGRCVGCGECERACPAGIPFTKITAHLANDCKRLFGSRPGDDPDAKRILVTFDEQEDAKLADFIL